MRIEGGGDGGDRSSLFGMQGGCVRGVSGAGCLLVASKFLVPVAFGFVPLPVRLHLDDGALGQPLRQMHDGLGRHPRQFAPINPDVTGLGDPRRQSATGALALSGRERRPFPRQARPQQGAEDRRGLETSGQGGQYRRPQRMMIVIGAKLQQCAPVGIERRHVAQHRGHGFDLCRIDFAGGRHCQRHAHRIAPAKRHHHAAANNVSAIVRVAQRVVKQRWKRHIERDFDEGHEK